MRGVANDRNTKIIYLVNGHKLNSQARDGFMSETKIGLLGDIQRVEVLRGPAGLVYGTGAIAGIVNVVTKKAKDNGSSATVAASNDGSMSVEANIHAVPSDDQQISVSAGYRKSEGFPYDKVRVYGIAGWPGAPGFKGGAPGDGRFGSTDGDWKVSGDWTLNNFNLYFRATRQKENNAALFILDPFPEVGGAPGSSVPGRVIDGNRVTYDDPYWSTTDNWRNGRKSYINDNVMAEASYDQPLWGNTLQLKLSFDKFQTIIGEEPLSKYQPEYVYPDGRVSETFGETRYMGRAMYLLKSVPRLQVAFGLEYRLDDFGPNFSGKNEQLGNYKHYIIKDTIYHTISNFAEGFYDITDIFGIHAGYRVDIHSRARMFNPKAALVLRPWYNHSFKLIYQSASNNGTVDNYEYGRYHVGDDGTINKKPVAQDPRVKPHKDRALVQPAPEPAVMYDLKPEKVHSVEFTYAGKIMDRLTIEPSFAWGKIKDLFGWSNDLFRVVNVGEYQYFNADLDIRYSTEKFKFGANHTIQRPVNTDPADHTQFKTYYIFENDSVNGEWGYFDGLDINGDSTYAGYYTQSKEIKLNVVQNSITYDGKRFMAIPYNMTKLYAMYFPFEWISVSSNLRLIWGLPGMKPVIEAKNDNSNYFGYYRELGKQSKKDFIMKSVSKKWNASLNVYLPKNFDVTLYIDNIIGSDNHNNDLSKIDRNTVNTFRKSAVYELDQRDLFSTDQRVLGINITKNF